MPLWLDAILIVVLALLIDRYIGEVPNSVHPLRWMGNMLVAIDRHVKSRQSWKATAAGFLSYLLVFAVFCGVGLCLTSLVRYGVSSVDPLAGEICWIILTALLFKINFAIFSFRKHTGPICEDLEKGDLESADARVQMIVSRDTRGMDAEHVASSCCETVTENLVDSVYSPLLYFGIGAAVLVPGVVVNVGVHGVQAVPEGVPVAVGGVQGHIYLPGGDAGGHAVLFEGGGDGIGRRVLVGVQVQTQGLVGALVDLLLRAFLLRRGGQGDNRDHGDDHGRCQQGAE